VWDEVGERENPVYRFSFTGLSNIIAEDETRQLSVRAQAASFIDSGDVPQAFSVSVGGGEGDDDGVLGTDAAGIRKEVGDWNETRTTTFVKE
jgi:hypothetical protein